MDKIGIIIQARATSTRFPNKVFANLNGKPVIQHVIDNIDQLKLPTVVAIPNTPSNDILYGYINEQRIEVFRGKENDVLDRYYQCATKYKFDIIVRVCADTPLIRPKDISDNLMKFIIEQKKRMIYGNGSWVFTYDMLKEAHETQVHAESREHVVRSMFNSIDYVDDIERVEKILKHD